MICFPKTVEWIPSAEIIGLAIAAAPDGVADGVELGVEEAVLEGVELGVEEGVEL